MLRVFVNTECILHGISIPALKLGRRAWVLTWPKSHDTTRIHRTEITSARILTGLIGLSPVEIKKFQAFCGLNKDSLGNETKMEGHITIYYFL